MDASLLADTYSRIYDLEMELRQREASFDGEDPEPTSSAYAMSSAHVGSSAREQGGLLALRRHVVLDHVC